MHSPTDHPGVTGHADAEHLPPLAVTVRRAANLSGLGLTSIWAALRDGRLDAVRVPGIRRTLISYASLARLLTAAANAPDARPIAPQLSSDDAGSKTERGSQSTPPRKRARPSKVSADFRRYLDELTGKSSRKATP